MKCFSILFLVLNITLSATAYDSLYYNIDDRLKVLFPCQPKKSDTIITMDQYTINMVSYYCKSDSGTFWVISNQLNDSFSIPDIADDYMKGIIIGTVEGNKGELIEEKDILNNKVPCKSYKVKFLLRDIPYTSENLVFVFKDKSYTLSILFQDKKENNILRQLRRNFLESYTLK